MKMKVNMGGALFLGAALAGNVYAGTLEDIAKKGHVSCGVSTGLAGFSQKGENGDWSGLDVDICRGIAAAVLGSADKVEYKPLNSKERFTALQSGEIDILSRNTTWTATRDISLGVNFAGTVYYDGTGFMVNKALGVNSAKGLNGAAVCIKAGTSTELAVADYFRQNGMTYKVVNFDTANQVRAGFEAGRCDVLVSDQSQLYSMRIGLTKPDQAVVLPEVISKEPLGPVVRQGDDAWFNAAKWVINAIIEAEYLGINSANAAEMAKAGNPAQKRLIGAEGDIGQKLGLDDAWASRVITQVGNYGEIFERNLGSGSPMKIARGLNNQWNNGGVLYSPPLR